MPVCSVCGQENPEVARFCLACGAALAAEPRREERKVVTVLFADLVGFTSRAEQLDPEDVRAVLAPYWERLRTELERRGGTVEKFIGDAVMALFGAPLAHEDDPLRAVGAALAIRDWAREEADVQVRIAVTTGEALILLGARPGEGEGMAAGDVVNTAARLQAAAPVNGVLVGETTYRATRDVIEYLDHEPAVAKGKAEPVPVWEAVQVRSRLGMDVEQATLPLVGRTRELGVIVDAFERAKAEREPQLVTLVGVPGIGKSRLVGEFFARLEQQPDLVWWRQGRALPYGEGVSFWAFAEMVKAQAGIDENDDEQTATTKLHASVDAYVDRDERDWVLGHLLPLVGLERSVSGDSQPAWRCYVEGLADVRPLVMVFEDMHWADDGLLDFIDHLVDWATGVPLLLIATSRPELLDRRPAWAGGRLNVSTIALTPLSDEESTQIILGVLEQSALPAETQQALVDRVGGNPLYAEQFARLYLERGSAEDLPLPETVLGLIAARLDGLAPGEKRIVQEASVFGKVFWGGAVDADDASLHSLERKEILRRERRSAVGGETQYAFRHILVRDVAYGQIPRAQRGEKHLRAADWIESLGRGDDHAELVAHHFLAARELGGVVDDVRLRGALRRAGERARALGAVATAARFFEQALDLWPEEDMDRATLQADHARVYAAATGDRSRLEPALAALEAAGLRDEAALLAADAANVAWRAGSPDAHELVEVAAELVESTDDRAVLAHVLHERARILWFRGDLDESRLALARVIALADTLDDPEFAATVLATEAVVAMFDGDLAEARELCERALELAPPRSLVVWRLLNNLGVLEFLAGNGPGWNERIRQAHEHALRAGDRLSLAWIEEPLAGHAMEVGQWDEALRRFERLLATKPVVYTSRNVLLFAAQIHASRGAVGRARELLDQGIADLDEERDGQTRIPARLVGAWVSYLVGDPAGARELVSAAIPDIEVTRHRAPGVSAPTTVAVIRAGYAEAFLRSGRQNARTRRVVAAESMLEGDVVEAADLWAEVSPYDEAVARVHAALTLAAGGRRVEADVQLERGLAFFRAVGARRMIELAEAPLRTSAAAE